jgi:hypothetical protein
MMLELVELVRQLAAAVTGKTPEDVKSSPKTVSE